MQDAKEEVRSRLNIEDVIGEYVQLKRAGRNFKGLSPFSGEKTPSFVVSPDKHIWHDFSSNKGGDIFSFVMEVEGLEFRAALEHLARKAGVDLSVYESKGSQELARRKKRLLEATTLAANYYQHSLLQNQHALDYVVKKRGLSKQIIEDFKIGYAPTAGDALVHFLSKKGFTSHELSDAGLTNRYGGDLFRGRMMVALMDGSGQVIGFTARVLSDEDPNAPKYLNTPQTLLYDKSRHVFGLSQAKEAIRSHDYAVVVEGNLDVVSSHQAGVSQVVATAGTAMTEQHLRALRRLSGNIRLAFDGDKAGLAATERAIPIASSVGLELTIISLPGTAKDPDELIQQDVRLWEQAISGAEPAVDWILSQYSHREDLTTSSGKRAFTTQALAIIRGLSDPVEQEHYEQKIATMVGSSLATIKAKKETEPQSLPTPLKQVSQVRSHDTRTQYDHVDTLLGLALISPTTRDLFNNVDSTIFSDQRQQAVATYLINSSATEVRETPNELQSVDEYVKIVIVRAEKRYEGWSDNDRYFETANLLRQYKTEHRKQTIEAQIQQAVTKGDEAEVERLRAEHYILIKEMKRGQK
jgi:DNA primase